MKKNLPESLWGEAVLHAAYVRNHSPTKPLDNKSPIEVLTGNKPNIFIMREFGEDVFVFEEIPKSKIEPKTRKVIFTGFEDGPRAIRYYDPNTRRITISRNYSFMPSQTIDSEDKGNIENKNLSNDNRIIKHNEVPHEEQVERLLRTKTES